MPGMDAQSVARAAATAPAGAASPLAVAEKAVAPDPVVVRSPAEIECEGRRGRFVTASGTGARACQFTTRDAGSACTRGSECEGDCLARSMTCAPVRPLFGCNDVIEDDGRRVSLCLE